MIHRKISSPVRSPQRKKRQTNSGRTLIGSAKSVEKLSTEDPVPVRYSDVYKQEKTKAELANMSKKKRIFPIAPDALIPNSIFRAIFKRKEIKPVEVKAFKLRLDILENLKNNDIKKLNWQDDDDETWTELDDPDAESKPTSERKTKGTLVSCQKLNNIFSDDTSYNIYWKKDTVPVLFKRMQNESWWKQEKDEKPNFRSMLNYLLEILQLKQIDSYESACSYIVEIFRTYGIEPVIVNQILDILLDHLTNNENNSSDVCTVRTIAQFMIERKDIIIKLLDYVLQCQLNDTVRQEIVNAIKFITDVNNSDDIELVLENISIVYDSPDDNFSLKLIIKGLENKRRTVTSQVISEGEESDEVHPLLKKISEERWFPRGNIPITLDYVLDAIISKLSDTTKTMVKTLTTHLIQIQRTVGYLDEQFVRVANGLISLLTHNEADYRLIAATSLATLNKETKAIDIALLNSFLNDARILVRTECGDSLKKLTGIMSDTVLKDCADDISYLQTLSEENFSLQNYLNEKNRVPTPPPSVHKEVSFSIEEQEQIPINEIEKNEDVIPIIHPRSPSPQIIEQPSITNNPPVSQQSEFTQHSMATSLNSSMTPTQPKIRVEITEKQNLITSHTPRSRKERTPIRQRHQTTSPVKTPLPDQSNRKRSALLPNSPQMWDSYRKQNEITGQKNNDEIQSNVFPVPQTTLIDQEQINDPIQTIIEEHKQTVGFFRIIPTRRVLVPHKVCMDNIFGDQSHIIVVNQYSQQTPVCPTNSMSLSDLNHNQHQLKEVEFVQLLSSLVIRAIQVHRQYEKLLPGAFSADFTNVISISQMQLHSSANGNSSSKGLPTVNQRPTTRQFARIQSNIQAKATRDGINLRKAQHMEGALSGLLRSNREPTKSTTFSSSSSHPSTSRPTDVTHAWLLVQLLKSQGISHSEIYLQKIIQSYPKFIPLLHKKIPHSLISIIWNDPIIKQIASIFGNKQDESTIGNSSTKQSESKPSDDEDFDYLSTINRDNEKKKYLPCIRGSKMNLPRHVLKFGYRDIGIDSSSSSNNSSRQESRSRSRKRRVCMHLMMSPTENPYDRHESVNNQLRQLLKPDYQTTSFVPIVARPPMCH